MFSSRISFILIVLICLMSVHLSFQIRSLRYLQGDNKFQKKVFVDKHDNYFYYDVYSTSDGKIEIDILNRDLSTEKLTFQQPNPLYYRDAYYNFIVLQQMNGTQSIQYWVLQIIDKSTTQQSDTGPIDIIKHQISAFPVNSTYDNQDYNMNNSYLLTQIIEYDEQKRILYVRLRSYNDTFPDGTPGDWDVYGIDLNKKSDKLITINWFYYTLGKKENVVGGNSRVIVDATNNQLLIDLQEPRNATDPSKYEKVDITPLTDFPLYDVSLAYRMRDTYFQYVSLTSGNTKMTTFLYHGYKKEAVQGAYNLQSQTPIKIFTDEYSYFVAVSDGDVYASLIEPNVVDSSKIGFFTGSLTQSISDFKQRDKLLQVFKSAVSIVQHEQMLYVLTSDKFYVYGFDTTLFEEYTLPKAIGSNTNVDETMFDLMQKYLEGNLP